MESTTVFTCLLLFYIALSFLDQGKLFLSREKLAPRIYTYAMVQ